MAAVLAFPAIIIVITPFVVNIMVALVFKTGVL